MNFTGVYIRLKANICLRANTRLRRPYDLYILAVVLQPRNICTVVGFDGIARRNHRAI